MISGALDTAGYRYATHPAGAALNLAGKIDSFNAFSTWNITDSTDFGSHCFRKFVQRTGAADLNREKEMSNF